MAEVVEVLSDSEDDAAALPLDEAAGALASGRGEPRAVSPPGHCCRRLSRCLATMAPANLPPILPACVDGWTCAACTLLNQSGFLACEACGSERPNPRAGGGAVANGASAPPPQGADQQASPEAESSGGSWNCGACTFENSCSIAECEMCGASGPEAVVAAVAAAAAAAAAAADADAPGPSRSAQTHAASGQMIAIGGAVAPPALEGLYNLDCGCRLPAAELQQHLLAAATTLPQRLPALGRHFCCPQRVRPTPAFVRSRRAGVPRQMRFVHASVAVMVSLGGPAATPPTPLPR